MSPLGVRVSVALVIFGMIGLLAWLAYVVASRLRRPEAGSADFVVVLGSTLTSDGQVPPMLAARLDKAHETAAALRDGAETRPVLLVSGGKTRRDAVAEAGPMAGYLVAAGEKAEELLLEDQSLTTKDNLRLAGRLMAEARPDGYRCVIVTSDYHCPRVAILARCGRLPATVVGATAPPGSGRERRFGMSPLSSSPSGSLSRRLSRSWRWSPS
ncbi:YdcF family protein [Catenulispora yoronensis]